jgi:hypothetical protein
MMESGRAVALAIKSEMTAEPGGDADHNDLDDNDSSIVMHLPGGRRRGPGQKVKIIQI